MFLSFRTERLYEELSVSGDCGQAMSRLGKYGAQHEPTDSEGEESCKTSIIRRVAKARRGIPDERQRLWYAGFAELATTFEVVNHMDKFKAELLTSFRHDDAARFDGLVDMVRLVHKLMLRGAKVGSKQTVRPDAPTTTTTQQQKKNVSGSRSLVGAPAEIDLAFARFAQIQGKKKFS